MMLNCFGIDKYDKLHAFMMHSVIFVTFRAKIITLSNFQMLAAMLMLCVKVLLFAIKQDYLTWKR